MVAHGPGIRAISDVPTLPVRALRDTPSRVFDKSQAEVDCRRVTTHLDYRAAMLAARRSALAGAHPTTEFQARLAAARADKAATVAA